MTDDKVKPWRWPGQWVRQESFWREVGTRTLAAVFAAGIVYVFAVAAGYIATPAISRIVISVLVAAGCLFSAFIIVGFWVAVSRKVATRFRLRLRKPSDDTVFLLVFLIALVLVIVSAIRFNGPNG